ncbi:MAG TPA: VOC family protein [Candidatus Saccharimonadales bacterium]|nr:VOC family protein [Candidatus Saccharimonadales bacterium]
MKPNSIAGFVCYVKDLDKTAKFYETLGFRFGKREGNRLTCYVNWFRVDFIAQDEEDKAEFQKEALADNKGAGIYINIKVDNVDEYHKSALAEGLKPSSEPRDWPWGNREFVMRDPDGYKLVFFQKL